MALQGKSIQTPDRALFSLVAEYARARRQASVRASAHLDGVLAHFRSEFMKRGFAEHELSTRYAVHHFFGAEAYALLDGSRVVSLTRIRTQGASFQNNLNNRLTEYVGWAVNARAAFPDARLGCFMLLVRTGNDTALRRSAGTPGAYATFFERCLAARLGGRPLVDAAAVTSGVLRDERITLDPVPDGVALTPGFFNILSGR